MQYTRVLHKNSKNNPEAPEYPKELTKSPRKIRHTTKNWKEYHRTIAKITPKIWNTPQNWQSTPKHWRNSNHRQNNIQNFYRSVYLTKCSKETSSAIGKHPMHHKTHQSIGRTHQRIGKHPMHSQMLQKICKTMPEIWRKPQSNGKSTQILDSSDTLATFSNRLNKRS